MTAPAGERPLNNQHCPEEIRENPQPHDQCSEDIPGWRRAGLRYRQISFHVDGQWAHNLAPKPDFSSFGRMGVGAVFRPFPYTPVGVFGLGFQFDTNFQDEILALGRFQTSFNIQRHGRERLTLAFLGGVRHLIDQPHAIPEGSDPQGVTGTLGVLGGEVALEARFLRWMTLVPFLSVQATLPGEVEGARDGARLSFPTGIDFILGARLTFDILPQGEANYL